MSDRSSASPAATSQPYNPNSGKGRKRSSQEPASKRAMQLRDSQRLHRERKAKYLKDLEDQVKHLTEENKEVLQLKQRIAELELKCTILETQVVGTQGVLQNIPISGLPCSNCAMERLKNSISSNQISSLESQLLHLRQECDRLTVAHSVASFLPNSLDAFFDSLQTPAVSTAAPIVKEELVKLFEYIRTEMKSLPSIHDSPLIDKLNELFNLKLESETDPTKAKRILLEISDTYFTLFNQCSVMDRVRMGELSALFGMHNQSEYQHVLELCKPYFPNLHLPPRPIDFSTLPLDLQRRLAILKSNLIIIPSFTTKSAMIDELCHFWALAVNELDKQSFVQVFQHLVKLEELCGDKLDDRTKLTQAMDVAWTVNQKEMHQLYELCTRMGESSLNDSPSAYDTE